MLLAWTGWNGARRACRSDLGRRVGGIAAGGLLAVLAAHRMPVHLALVRGGSMTPTLQPGQPLIYATPTAQDAPLSRGELVLVRLDGELCVKRVFALGGDRFWTLREGPAPITPLDPHTGIRRWRQRYPDFHYRRFQVPSEQIFVVGENLSSLDSRNLGPVPSSAVVGRVVFPAAAPPDNSTICRSMPAQRHPVPRADRV